MRNLDVRKEEQNFQECIVKEARLLGNGAAILKFLIKT